MRKKPQSVTSDWQRVDQKLIAGVVVREVRAVGTAYGALTEVFRSDWELDDGGVDQIFQSVLEPGTVSAWHAHADTTDRLFVSTGRLDLVLYDSRPDAPTSGELNRFAFGTFRPALLVVPPRVWHGVHNSSSATAVLLNAVDRAYRYDGPDHWCLPPDSDAIPHRFPESPGGWHDPRSGFSGSETSSGGAG
jgi:dTDP-4-dehydrorhamnose 3,5-epimerase